MISLERLKKIFDHHFSPPFLPEGMVRVEKTEEETFLITIGRRDIEINDIGQVISSGTSLMEGF